MDIATLQQTLNSHLVGGVFTLDSSGLASTEITQLFTLYLSYQQLGLTGASIAPVENNTSITVSGTGNAPPFSNMAVQATFSIVNGTVELLLNATAPTGWTLPDSFPAWQHDFFPDLQFISPPQLQLSTSHASLTTSYGLFFHGVLDTQAVMGPFVWFINGQSSLAIQGSITMDGAVPRTVLASDPNATPSMTLGFLELSSVVLEVVTNEDAIANPSPLNAPVIFRFATSIEFITDSGTLVLPLRANFYGQDLIGLQADLSQVVNASLQAFSSLLNHVDINRPELLPPGLDLAQVLTLQYLSVQVSIDGTPQIKLVSLGIEKQGDPWTITQGIAIDNISVYFSVTDPMNTRYLSAGLYGVLAIGAGFLDVSAEYPNFMVNGQLQDGSEINLLEIINQFCGTSGDSNAGMDSIDVIELDFSLGLSPLSYAFSFMLEGSWFVNLIDAIFFELEELSFSLNKDAGDSVTGSLAATSVVAGVALSISASQPVADGGWNFEGSTGPGQTIPIGSLIDSLAGLFGAVTLPAAISEMTIENLHVSFNTNITDFTFTCESKLPVGDQILDITVTIDLKDGANGYTKTFSGHILIAGLIFDLQFLQNTASTIFVATYSHSGAPQSISVKDLISSVSSDVASVIPADLSIDLKDVIFAFSKDDTGSTFLFGLDISATIPSLTNLPLVGKDLPTDQSISVNDLQILVVSQDIKQSVVASFNTLIPTGVTHLAATDLSKGLALSASMTFGGAPQILAVPVVSGGTPAPTTTTVQPGVTSADNAKWFTLQKSFGPIDFKRVGIQYKDAAVLFLLDAALTALGLTISLDGLSFGSPLGKFAPVFDLRGLGIAYTGGDAVSITGAFLNAGNDEYIGEALIKTSELTISALGSYASLNGNPSLFVYAFLDQAIGGPSFFFVTGLAAGFGYNRSLLIPSIDQVSQFPLIDVVMSNIHRSLGEELTALDQYIPPSAGDLFFALGVRFTSFKIIESFALLTVGLGTRVEIAVLGLSTLISPPPEEGKSIPPLAAIYMALKASFVPAEGFLGVDARLTSASFLFSQDCHLVGGYAFYSWFSGDHAGDFVMTLGGYHPAFQVPDHYPKVPRAGFSWQVDSNLLMKGNLYFALTSSALMAGGALEVTWNSGPFKAWFSAGADFLLAWKPYHYDASFYVNIGAAYTFEIAGSSHQISVDVGASVHVWGPDFSGLAHVDLSIISFDIAFGSGSNQTPDPIDWPTFESSFLPASNSVCNIAVRSGLVSTPQTGAIQWVVNAKELDIIIGTVIPISGATFNGDPIKNAPAQAFGIGSMAVTASDLTSVYAITVSRDNMQITQADFECVPVLKNMPVALWGEKLQPDLNGDAFIPNALAGFELRPTQAPITGTSVTIDPDVLGLEPELQANAYTWQSSITFVATDDTDAARRTRISETIVAPVTLSARSALLAALALNVPIDVNTDVASTFQVAPQIAHA